MPKLHKVAPKADRVQMLQVDPVAEPFTSKLEKNEQGFKGVASLIGSLVADLTKESQEAKVEEDHSQGDYEGFMKDSSQSRAEKVQEVEELQNTKAALSSSLAQSKEEFAAAVTSAAEIAKVLSSLHQSCDWFLENLDAQKTARTGEVEALHNAKAVLAGAQYSL